MSEFSLTHWIIVGVIVWVLFRAFERKSDGVARHCMTCGTDGKTKTATRGSIWIEVVLWLCLIVPGLIYSIWRLTTRRQVCGTCGADNVVPMDTPAAQSHRKGLLAPVEAPTVQRKEWT